MNGLSKSLIDNAINTQYSHIQIHHPEYNLEDNPGFVIEHGDSLIAALNSNNKIESYTMRAKIEGLATTQKSSRGIKIIGVDPKTGKFKLSRKALLPKPEQTQQGPRQPQNQNPRD